jgi:hypothetical protein
MLNGRTFLNEWEDADGSLMRRGDAVVYYSTSLNQVRRGVVVGAYRHQSESFPRVQVRDGRAGMSLDVPRSHVILDDEKCRGRR